MKKEDAEEYTAIREQHFHSSYRDIALGIKLGVPKALGLSTEDWVRRIGGRVKMSIDERKEAAKDLKSEGNSNRRIGETLGVTHATVASDLVGGQNSPPTPKKINDFNMLNVDGGQNLPARPEEIQQSPKTSSTISIQPDPPIKKPDYGQDDEDSLIKAKQAARHAKEILAKIEKKGTSFLSLRENALAASNEWAKVANAAVQPSTTLRSVE